MSKSLIIYFSRADENYAVGYIDKGNTEIVAEYVQELTSADTEGAISAIAGKGIPLQAVTARDMLTVRLWVRRMHLLPLRC